MKIQFKVQEYQTEAVNAVVDCFAGQPYADGVKYRVDPGRDAAPILYDDSGIAHVQSYSSHLLASVPRCAACPSDSRRYDTIGPDH